MSMKQPTLFQFIKPAAAAAAEETPAEASPSSSSPPCEQGLSSPDAASAATTSSSSDRQHNNTPELQRRQQRQRASVKGEGGTAGAAAAAVALTQTFLDFGQSTLAAGTTCARCGMLYSGLEEDVRLHRRFCARRRGRQRQGEAESGAPLGPEVLPLLEKVHRACAVAPEAGRTHQNNNGSASAARCVREELGGAEGTAGGRPTVLYAIRCAGGSAVDTDLPPALLLLLDLLGFGDAVLAPSDGDSPAPPPPSVVVCVAAPALGCALVAAAGRPRRRQRDPEVCVTTTTDGRTLCGVSERATHADVCHLRCRPPPLVAAALPAAAPEPAASFFEPASARAARRRAAEEARLEEARRAVAAAVAAALRLLAAATVPGAALHPLRHLSYARAALRSLREAGLGGPADCLGGGDSAEQPLSHGGGCSSSEEEDDASQDGSCGRKRRRLRTHSPGAERGEDSSSGSSVSELSTVSYS